MTRGQLVDMDASCDNHPEITEQLRKDPSLVDNKQFVESHAALQQFLADHPGVRDEFKSHPEAFMHDENRFDRREDPAPSGHNTGPTGRHGRVHATTIRRSRSNCARILRS